MSVLPISPSMEPALESVSTPRTEKVVSLRLVTISGIAIAVGIAGGFIAKILMSLIGLITNSIFYGRWSTALVPPVLDRVGIWVLVVPVVGALIVGVMARFGSSAIRGHGIPEVMEKVLYGQSRIPARLMFLKPISAAIAIGTGGPFGAEGPIIATGGALGSVIGQVMRITADERKILLAAGAAAGMAATFGTPVAAVLLAIELLLFEYKARSIIPVALASSGATATRMILMGTAPVFPMPLVHEPTGQALASYVVLGALVGLASVAITRVVFIIEYSFERLPIHWMWWPALGAVAVGIIGYLDPRTLGVGYQHIHEILAGHIAGTTLLFLVLLKFVSWAIYLGSGTSGGTLAPLFIIGGGLGALLGTAANHLMPSLGISVGVAGLVGMAAVFAGASHAMLTSVVFAFEATRQPLGLLPLLAGCSAAYLISTLLMKTSIMTEKLAHRGAGIRSEYVIDYLSQVLVGDVMTRDVITLAAEDTLERVREWLASHKPGTHHQGFPVVEENGTLVGVVTRRNLFDAEKPEDTLIRDLVIRPPSAAFESSTLREAADHMVREGVGRLPVVVRATGKMTGIISRSDLLSAHEARLRAADEREQSYSRS